MRSPKIYKEYRDFMINRYREDPSRRLTFTEVRKSLVGDVSLLHKVFQFLNDCGLINFGAESAPNELDNEEKVGVRVEDGPPNAVRVAATPNSLTPISAPHAGAPPHIDGGFNRSKLPPLASYSDVFGELGRLHKGTFCRCCGGNCESGRYVNDKDDNHVICVKCFNDGKYGNDSADNFKLRQCSDSSTEQSDLWTDAETLLLLEAVLKHGDDWDLVAQSVKTKTKLECISKLIELPVGQFISTSSSLGRNNARGVGVTADSGKKVPLSLPGQQDVTTKQDELFPALPRVNDQNGYDAGSDPPLKKQRVSSPSGSGISIMKQVAQISSMVRADITTAASQAAFAALCDEASCPRESFDNEENFINTLWPQSGQPESERAHQDEDTEKEGVPAQSEAPKTDSCQNDVPLTLRLRATVAAALGAAAAHGKLLADEEDQQIEALVGTITETQLKKLQCKMKDLDDMEAIMEKEHAELEEVKRCLAEQPLDILGRGGKRADGISKLQDDSSVKSENANVS
ncbi:SWI/SNF complex subunit SWI3A [Linum grandiflorum]